MPVNDFIIRNATAKDMKEVAKMIREYATDDEEVPEGPQLGCADLVRDLFERAEPLFQCQVAQMCEGRLIIGYVVYYPTYSSWLGKALKLEDIFVRKDHRRKGVGSALFNVVAKVAMETMCCRIDFYVIEGSPATKFYKERGAMNLTKCGKWYVYCIRGDALSQAASEAC